MFDCKSIKSTSRDRLRSGRQASQSPLKLPLLAHIHLKALNLKLRYRYRRINLPGTGGWDWAATWCWSGIGQLQYLQAYLTTHST
ncbi:unnamed protein product [Brassica oleracea]